MTTPPLPEDYHPWTTYYRAREEARRRGDRRVGTEHLVLGVLCEPLLAAAVGDDWQHAREALDALDRDALRGVGVSDALDAPPIPVRAGGPRRTRPTLAMLPRDRVPLTPAAKATLRTCAKRGRGRGFDKRAVLLALLELQPPDPGAELLDALHVDRAAIRARLAAG